MHNNPPSESRYYILYRVVGAVHVAKSCVMANRFSVAGLHLTIVKRVDVFINHM